MKIDITAEPDRVAAQKRISLEHPDKYFVPIWDPTEYFLKRVGAPAGPNKRFYMVDEEEIQKDLEHYRKLAGLIWFVHHKGHVTMKLGQLTL